MKKIILSTIIAAFACVSAVQAGENSKNKVCPDAAKAKGAVCADAAKAKGAVCADAAKAKGAVCADAAKAKGAVCAEQAKACPTATTCCPEKSKAAGLTKAKADASVKGAAKLLVKR